MVAGLGLLEEPEPVGGHIDDRGIRICGQNSPGLGLQTGSRAPDSAAARSAASRPPLRQPGGPPVPPGCRRMPLPEKAGVRPSRPFPECHRSADPPCRSHHRMRSPAGNRTSRPELRGPTTSVPPPSRQRVPCREPSGDRAIRSRPAWARPRSGRRLRPFSELSRRLLRYDCFLPFDCCFNGV